MNDTERHWILDRAKRVLDPDVYAALEASLSRPAGSSSSGQSGEPDGSLNTGPGPSGKPSETWTEAENREAYGR